MIELQRVQKVVDGHTALVIDELVVEPGQVSAVVGPADSGIDALQALLIGRTRPTSGRVAVAGCDPFADRDGFSRTVGVLFVDDALYSSRSVRGNLSFHARLRGLPKGRADEVLALVGLADHAGAKLDKLSSSLSRRLAFGVAVLHEPHVLLLADPFARCDEASIALLSQRIAEHAEGGGSALILADNDAYLFDLCATIHSLEQGRIVGSRNPRDEATGNAMPFKIPVKAEGSVVLVNPADILYVVSEDGRVSLHTRNEKLPTQYTLTELEARLSRSGFFRAHRGYLVNLQHVVEVIPFTRSSFSLRLGDPDDTMIPLSKDAARELRELLDF
jgi:ABC-2 type transport system ATP-binding protein